MFEYQMNNQIDKIIEVAKLTSLARDTHDDNKTPIGAYRGDGTIRRDVEKALFSREFKLSGKQVESCDLLIQSPVNFQAFSGVENQYCGFVASTSDEVVISLRGTQDLNDTLVDMFAFPNAAGFHRGFNFYADKVLEQIRGCGVLEQAGRNGNDDGKRIIVSGHSLGAAAAALMTYKLNKAGFKNIETYTFGTPAFHTRPLEYDTPIFNLRDSIDPVPFLLQGIVPTFIHHFLVGIDNVKRRVPIPIPNVIVSTLRKLHDDFRQYKTLKQEDIPTFEEYSKDQLNRFFQGLTIRVLFDLTGAYLERQNDIKSQILGILRKNAIGMILELSKNTLKKHHMTEYVKLVENSYQDPEL
ncbi:MAG: lipase family protein [Xenococcus sp. MO_188.B8]|nr:lipase family protein [Xenococcus sp. MO_188.B8]